MKIINSFHRHEELANFISHTAGALLALSGAIYLIIKASVKGNLIDIISVTIFGIALVLMYIVSAVYHGLKEGQSKSIFQIFDHAAIYILIAGTYTPFLLCLNINKRTITLLIIQWIICFIGIIFKIFFVDRFVLFSTSLYIVMGWLIVFVWDDIIPYLNSKSFVFLVLGGVLYTVGTIFYMFRFMKFHHLIWHIFVILGSLCHYFAILYMI